MSEELSEPAERLLAKALVLRREYPDGWVPDEILWEAAELAYERYVVAAEELVEWGLAESQGSDYAALRATPEGIDMVPGA